MKSATNARGRTVVELLRRPELLDPAAVHDRDPVAHRERLLLVVGHVDERDPDLGLDALELDLEALPELEVEGAEGLVEEQHVRPVDEGAGERDPLLLAAGQLVRLALLVARQVDQLERLTVRRAISVLGRRRLRLSPKAMLPADVEVREQRVVLEDHVDRPLVRRIVGDVAAAQLDPAARSGSSNPPIIRSVVVLPQPDGPSSEKNSPARISIDTSSTARTSRKCLASPTSRISATGAVGLVISDRDFSVAPTAATPARVAPGRSATMLWWPLAAARPSPLQEPDRDDDPDRPTP